MFASAGQFPTRRVLGWGDSLIAGAPYNGLSGKTSYATEAVRLSEGKLSAVPNFNQGIGGENTTEILARLGNWNTVTPQLYGVFMDGGINDFGTTKNLDQATVIANIKQMIAEVRALGAWACWLAVPPPAGTTGGRRVDLNSQITAHMAALNATIPGGGRHCVVPMENWDAGLYTDDGTHPNQAGQPFVGQRALDAVTAAGWFKA